MKSTNWLENHKRNHSETSWSPTGISKGKIQQDQNHYRRQNQSKDGYPHNPESRCRWSGLQKTPEPVPVFKSFTVLIGARVEFPRRWLLVYFRAFSISIDGHLFAETLRSEVINLIHVRHEKRTLSNLLITLQEFSAIILKNLRKGMLLFHV